MSQQLVVATHTIGKEIEAEPIVIDTDDPQTVVFEFDNGERWALDRRELDAALEAAA